MAYIVDRSRGLYIPDIVAIMSVRLRKVRSRVIMKDNSLYHTLTRPQTLAQRHGNAFGLRVRKPHGKDRKAQ